ncbi:hypothetical protein [Streptomyces fradiae]|uniref:hypothetical protein n=2 Tax=Streptomyces fradiae TaxID=1906 RepID=UPI0037A05722
MDTLWSRTPDLALLLFAPLLAWTAGGWWRHPERAPAWAARRRPRTVRCWAAAFVLLGIGMGSSGVYGLTGLPEPWVAGFCRTAGPLLYLLAVWGPAVREALGRDEDRPAAPAPSRGTPRGPKG